MEKYDLEAFEDMVRHGYLRKAEKGDLVLYGYTDKTTFERAWQTKYTLHARGIIFNKKTGHLIAKPFPKFFNLGEMENVSLVNLPKEPYRVYEKVDGSLGIIFYYQGRWHIATRGSFSSEQAMMGQIMLDSGQYKLQHLDPNVTYLVEIIYPENKIIVDYKGERCLICLGAYNTITGEELNQASLSNHMTMNVRMPCAEVYDYTIEEMIELQKTLPKDDEGFVVRFESGLRVKIKGHEYLRIAKMISQMSPLSFWEAMKDGKVGREYVQQLPEEFRKEYEPMIDQLEKQYAQAMFEVDQEANDLHCKLQLNMEVKECQKELGLLLQSKDHGLKHPGAMFSFLKGKSEAVEKYVMKLIRPTGNAFVSLE